MAPPGVHAAASTSFFPSILSSPIQANGVFQLFVKRNPEVFVQTQTAVQNHMDTGIQQKLFCVDCFAFCREIVLTYLPQFFDLGDCISDHHSVIPPNSIPPQVAYPLLGFLDFTVALSQGFPEIEQINSNGPDFLRCVISQAVGEEAIAVDSARQIISLARSRLSAPDTAPTLKVIIPVFIGCACLFNYGHILEADTHLSTIVRFSPLYELARQAQTVLTSLKKRVQLNPGPGTLLPATPPALVLADEPVTQPPPPKEKYPPTAPSLPVMATSSSFTMLPSGGFITEISQSADYLIPHQQFKMEIPEDQIQDHNFYQFQHQAHHAYMNGTLQFPDLNIPGYTGGHAWGQMMELAPYPPFSLSDLPPGDENDDSSGEGGTGNGGGNGFKGGGY